MLRKLKGNILGLGCGAASCLGNSCLILRIPCCFFSFANLDSVKTAKVCDALNFANSRDIKMSLKYPKIIEGSS